MRPLLFLPPVLFLGAVKAARGRPLYKSGVLTLTTKRRPGEVVSILLKPSYFIRIYLKASL